MQGVDSASAPSAAAIEEIKPAFWGGYIGGTDAAGIWGEESWELLKAHNVKPLPIWVPLQNCSEDPAVVVADAIAACKKAGILGVVCIDTEASMRAVLNHEVWLDGIATAVKEQSDWTYVQYNGVNYLPKGAIPWLAKWDNSDLPEETEGAHQYVGNKTEDGIEVDLDVATANFPLAHFGTPESPKADTAPPTITPTATATPVIPKVADPPKVTSISTLSDALLETKLSELTVAQFIKLVEDLEE